jgi:hypothetical protein
MNSFIADYDIDDALRLVKKDLRAKAKKNGQNLYQQVALVTKNGEPVGYLEPMEIFETLSFNDNLSLEQCVKNIPLPTLNHDVTLVEFADWVGWPDPPPKYFVFKEEECIGWITYIDINKSFFHICLFALIQELEENFLKVLMKFPQAFNFLTPYRQKKARSNFKENKFENGMVGSPSYQNLLECTSLKDKMDMLKRHPITKGSCPAIYEHEGRFCKLVVIVRNNIAHAGLGGNLAYHIPPMDLFLFIGWAIVLSDQLGDFSEDKSIYQ